MKTPALGLLTLVLTGTALLGYDSDAPLLVKRQVERALPAPVRVNILYLSRNREHRVQSLQFPVLRVEPGRTATVQIGDDRFSISGSEGVRGSVAISVKHSVLDHPTKVYRLMAAKTVMVQPKRLAVMKAGDEEFRITADLQPGEDRESVRYSRTQ